MCSSCGVCSVDLDFSVDPGGFGESIIILGVMTGTGVLPMVIRNNIVAVWHAFVNGPCDLSGY